MGVRFCSRWRALPRQALPFCVIRPNTWNRESAFPASTILDVILQHVVPRAANQQFLAVRTTRVRAIAVDISFVDVTKANLKGNLAGLIERLRRCARLILQLEVRMKRREMQGHIWPPMSQ